MKKVQNEVVEETAAAVQAEEVLESPVQTEETALVNETSPKGESGFLFNLLSLCIAAFLLVADIYLLIAMNTGIIRVGDTQFTAFGILTYLQRTVAVGFGSMEVERIGGLLIFVMFSVIYIVFWINILIGVIKSIVKILS